VQAFATLARFIFMNSSKCHAHNGEYQDIHDHARRTGTLCEACEVVDEILPPTAAERRMFRAEGRMR